MCAHFLWFRVYRGRGRSRLIARVAKDSAESDHVQIGSLLSIAVPYTGGHLHY